MGVSTSGSFLLVATGVFLAFGTMYSTTANTAERRHDALEDRRAHESAVAESGVAVAAASYDAGADTLEIRVNNTGETTLAVAATDLLVDGDWVALSAFETIAVDGVDTDTWLPGQQLRLVDADRSTAPDRVKVVTGAGVAATGEVA